MRRAKRSIIFVLGAIRDGAFISHAIEANNAQEASVLFEEAYRIRATIIHGPYYNKGRKKEKVSLDNAASMQFSGTSEPAIYDGWMVLAMHLKKPASSAFLIFDRRIDGKKVSKPGNTIVKLSELKPC